MNWEAVGAVGETIGAIGVICTLIFLAFQIRQNTKLLETNVTQLEQNRELAIAETLGQSDTSREQAMIAIAQNKDLSHIYYTGLNGYDDLSLEEKLRFALILGPLIGGVASTSERQAQLGLHSDIPPGNLTFVLNIIGTPGGRHWWRRFSDTYPDRFRRAIDREFKKVDESESKDRTSQVDA